MNDDGGERQKPPKMQFLGQRKWIILCATTVFLLHNGYLRLVENWMAFSFSIDETSSKLLHAIALAGLFFFGYMLASSYTFFKKHKVEIREVFQKLELDEKDTISEEIQQVSEQIKSANMQAESAEQQVRVNDSKIQELSSRIDSLNLLSEELNGYPPSIQPEQLPEKNRSYLWEVIEEFRNRQSSAPGITNALSTTMTTGPMFKSFLGLKAHQLEQNAKMLARDQDRMNSTAVSNRAEVEVYSDRVKKLEAERLKLAERNEREWERFYFSRTVADLISITPALIASAYCANYLLSSPIINAIDLLGKNLSFHSTAQTVVPAEKGDTDGEDPDG